MWGLPLFWLASAWSSDTPDLWGRDSDYMLDFTRTCLYPCPPSVQACYFFAVVSVVAWLVGRPSGDLGWKIRSEVDDFPIGYSRFGITFLIWVWTVTIHSISFWHSTSNSHPSTTINYLNLIQSLLYPVLKQLSKTMCYLLVFTKQLCATSCAISRTCRRLQSLPVQLRWLRPLQWETFAIPSISGVAGTTAMGNIVTGGSMRFQKLEDLLLRSSPLESFTSFGDLTNSDEEWLMIWNACFLCVFLFWHVWHSKVIHWQITSMFHFNLFSLTLCGWEDFQLRQFHPIAVCTSWQTQEPRFQAVGWQWGLPVAGITHEMGIPTTNSTLWLCFAAFVIYLLFIYLFI